MACLIFDDSHVVRIVPLWWNRQTQGTLMFARADARLLYAESARREICDAEVG